MKNRGLCTLISIILIAVIVSACAKGQSDSNTPQSQQPTTGISENTRDEGGSSAGEEPVTLKVLRAGITVTESEFEQTLVQATKEAFPYVTLQWVEAPEDVDLQALITAGDVPDLIFVATSTLSTTIADLQLAEDLQPYIEKYDVDLSRLKPVVLNTVQQYSPEGELHGFPFSVNLPVLFYNKDIFDKFGVSYPPDEQMSWKEAIELGAKVTRNDQGVDYIGIDLFGSSNIATGLDLTILDPDTGLADVTTPQWTKVFQHLQQSYEVPGYIGQDGRYQYADDDDIFFSEQNIAMVAYNLAHLLGPLEELRAQGIELNWDFAPFPNFEENLGTGKGANIHSIIVTKTSKHKDIAFQVLANLLSDEAQLALSQGGRVPTIEGEQFEAAFGANIAVLENKKVENIFKAPPREVVRPHKFESKVRKFLTEAEQRIAVEGQDINSALRIAQDGIEKELVTLSNTQ